MPQKSDHHPNPITHRIFPFATFVSSRLTFFECARYSGKKKMQPQRRQSTIVSSGGALVERAARPFLSTQNKTKAGRFHPTRILRVFLRVLATSRFRLFL
jgi:hypothetical protein